MNVTDELISLEWLAGRNACFLSPHPDDAAFSSAGALLCLNQTLGVQCDVTVAFSKSSFMPDKPDDIDLETVERVTQVRNAEDRQFVKLFADEMVTMNWLGFNDAPLRGYRTSNEYQSGKPLIAYDLELAWAVAETVAPDLQEGTVVFAPLAVGRHVDHRIVRTAALALKSAMNIELLLYEDMPYSTNYGVAQMPDIANILANSYGIELKAIMTSSADLVKFKRQAIGCYPSQVVTSELEAILSYAVELNRGKSGAERLWQVILTNSKIPIVA